MHGTHSVHLGHECDARLVGKRENFLSVAVDNGVDVRKFLVDLGEVREGSVMLAVDKLNLGTSEWMKRSANEVGTAAPSTAGLKVRLMTVALSME
jgi:hypothetical protein